MIQEQRTLKLSQIVQGKNPRTHFDATELNQLAASIKVLGVMQPIMVRPLGDDRYEIIAGERRWRASILALGADGDIPALIRECDDDNVNALALVENTIRAAMSATEEADQAFKVLSSVNGDKAEAYRLLNWTPTMLERRLALLRLTPEVKTALNTRQIKLGHAELLAAIPADKQNSILEKIVQHKIDVPQVKAQLSKMAQALKEAVFNQTDCTTCEFNSQCQSALFAEAIGDGYCTNPTCFAEKTDAHIETIAVQMREEVPRVEVIQPASVLKTIKLTVDGSLGVGEEQAKACKSCANYGCTISGFAGTVGQVEHAICFDQDCNTQKVQDNLVAQASAVTAKVKAVAEVKANGGDEKQAQEAGEKAAQATKKQAKAKATSVNSQRVNDYRLTLWRSVAAKVMFANPELSTCVLLSLAMSGNIRQVGSTKVCDGFKQLNSGVGASSSNPIGDTASQVFNLTLQDRATMVSMLAPSAMKECDERNVRSILGFLQVDLGLYWKLNEEFLKLLTKSEIEYLAGEIGLDKAMGEKPFAKALGGKRDELIKAVLSVADFEYKGVVPNCMRFDVEKSVASAIAMSCASEDQGDDDQGSDQSQDEGGDGEQGDDTQGSEESQEEEAQMQ